MSPFSKEIQILLVDDEDSVRNLLQTALENTGLKVLTASSAEEAIEVLSACPAQPISLLLSDILMPGVSGIELAEHFTRLYPKSGVILMSGYLKDWAVPASCCFLQKPFPINTLIERVKDALQLLEKSMQASA